MSRDAVPTVHAEALVTEILTRGLGVRFSARGGSMRPTIRGGEAITVTPVAIEAVAAGDIVLFRRRGRMVVHRVLRVLREGDVVRFLTRGDASVAADPPLEACHVLGRVVAVERDGRDVDLTGARSRWSCRAARCLCAARGTVRRVRRAFGG